MQIYIAPVQGHTDAAWRRFHNDKYGDAAGPAFHYFTPFMRCEHGELRKGDLKDFTNPLNDGVDVEPQVIFRDMEELTVLLDALSAEGVTRVNLNMGCPFPLQMGKGRGAGILDRPDMVRRLPETLKRWPGISFSVKMRLGHNDASDWREILPVLNEIPLRFIALHPRTGKQQYSGELDYESFGDFLRESRNPVVFNGGIRTPQDALEIANRYPSISGIMLGRGVLGRPSLATETAAALNAAADAGNHVEWDKKNRLEEMLDFHHRLYTHYSDTLCGDAQVLSKIKPFWEYAEEEAGRKAWKAIRKAGNRAKYNTAVGLVGNS